MAIKQVFISKLYAASGPLHLLLPFPETLFPPSFLSFQDPRDLSVPTKKYILTLRHHLLNIIAELM